MIAVSSCDRARRPERSSAGASTANALPVAFAPPTTIAPATRASTAGPSGGASGRGALRANVEDALLQRLTAPLRLHSSVLTARGTDCDSLVFTAASSDGSRIHQGAPFNQALELHGGALLHSSLLTYFRMHGQSAESVLMNGREWFFDRDACLKNAFRYPPFEGAAESALSAGDAGRSFEQSRWQLEDGRAIRLSRWPEGHGYFYEVEGALYEIVPYFALAMAWLRGPRGASAARPEERRHGLYTLRLHDGYLDLGRQRWCRRSEAATGCPTRDATLQVLEQPFIGAWAGIDAAERFWARRGRFFVPVVDGPSVLCRSADVSAAGGGAVSVVTGSLRRTYRIRRAISGLLVAPAAQPLLVGPDAVLVVHGFDDESFFVSGSRWFTSEKACGAGRTSSKPANFDPTGSQSSAPGALKLERSYFRTDRGATPRVCHSVRIEPVTPTVGRISVESTSGIEEFDFDFYPLDYALWLGKKHAAAPARTDRMSGRLLRLRRERDKLLVDDEIWYESKLACASAGKAAADGH